MCVRDNKTGKVGMFNKAKLLETKEKLIYTQCTCRETYNGRICERD